MARQNFDQFIDDDDDDTKSQVSVFRDIAEARADGFPIV